MRNYIKISKFAKFGDVWMDSNQVLRFQTWFKVHLNIFNILRESVPKIHTKSYIFPDFGIFLENCQTY